MPQTQPILKQGDCLELLKELPDGSIDMVLTDPPYGIDYLSPRTSHHHKLPNDADERIDLLYSKFLPDVVRILNKRGVFASFSGGGGKKPTTAYATLEIIKHMQLIQTCIWSKGKKDGSFMGLGWKYRPSYETVLIAAKSEDYAFYKVWRKTHPL